HLGASLLAFVKLGREKGYRLVGSNRFDYNAFFVAAGEGEDALPSVPVDTCLMHPARTHGHREVLPLVENLQWTAVGLRRAAVRDHSHPQSGGIARSKPPQCRRAR